MRIRYACTVAIVGLLSNGCAALSLFGSSHEHTHYHGEQGCGADSARLSALESRLVALEAKLAPTTIVPVVPHDAPTLVTPAEADVEGVVEE